MPLGVAGPCVWGQAGRAGCGLLETPGGQQGMCVLQRLFGARRAAEELENFTEASEGDLWSQFGDRELNHRP